MTYKFKISGNTVQTNINLADFCDILLKVQIGITVLQMKWLFSFLFVDFKYINSSCGFFSKAQNHSFVIATLLRVIFKIAEKMFHFNFDIYMCIFV